MHTVPKRGSPMRLVLASFSASLLYVSTGCVMAWPSPTLPRLGDKITREEGSWIGSLYALGAILGPWLSFITLDRWGRKPTLLLLAVTFLISWVILAISQQLWVIYLARVIGGIGVGGSFSSVSVYISEIADDELRGALGSINQMFVGMGFMVQYCAGPYISYDLLLVVSGIIAVAFIAIFFWMPESPYFLLKNGSKDAAVKSLCWLRGGVLPFMVEREFSGIEEAVVETQKKVGNACEILEVGSMRALLICFYLMLVQQLSGFNAIVSFTQAVFDLAKISLPSTISAMLVGAVNLFSSGLAPPLVKRFGIKAIFIASALGMGLCLVGMSIFFLFKQEGYSTVGVNFFPVATLMIYNIFFCIGVAPLPWGVVAEMFPTHLKGFASSLLGTVSWFLGFVVIKGFGVFLVQIGPFPVFTTFACCLLTGVFGVFFVLPNTKGMSLQDIQDLLHDRKSDSTENLDQY